MQTGQSLNTQSAVEILLRQRTWALIPRCSVISRPRSSCLARPPPPRIAISPQSITSSGHLCNVQGVWGSAIGCSGGYSARAGHAYRMTAGQPVAARRTMLTFRRGNLTCGARTPETLSRPATYGRGAERHRRARQIQWTIIGQRMLRVSLPGLARQGRTDRVLANTRRAKGQGATGRRGMKLLCYPD